jgi:TonB family protein
MLIPIGGLASGSEAFIRAADEGSAVDAKGIRHTQSPHPTRLAPWMQDRVKSIAPYYPYEDRRLHHVGTGWFRLNLDLGSGVVTKVTVLKSTGFSTLDDVAITTFRGWRWRPGRWKEIDIPVKFDLYRGSPTPPPADWVRLPPH